MSLVKDVLQYPDALSKKRKKEGKAEIEKQGCEREREGEKEGGERKGRRGREKKKKF